MSNNQKLADDLMNALELSLPPIAVSFCDAPSNIAAFDGIVPAGCVFWQEAATRTFATSAKDHGFCAIGVHTHNMSQRSRSHSDELQEVLRAMMRLDYAPAKTLCDPYCSVRRDMSSTVLFPTFPST